MSYWVRGKDIRSELLQAGLLLPYTCRRVLALTRLCLFPIEESLMFTYWGRRATVGLTDHIASHLDKAGIITGSLDHCYIPDGPHAV